MGNNLQTPEIQEKRRAAIKAGAKRNAAKKFIKRIHDLDLGPLDEQIAELKKQIAELDAMRAIVLQIRNGGQVDPPASAASQAPSIEDRVEAYLRRAGMAKPMVIAADLGTSIPQVLRVLRDGNQFEESLNGWKIAS
jgi:hypothetical protein